MWRVALVAGLVLLALPPAAAITATVTPQPWTGLLKPETEYAQFQIQVDIACEDDEVLFTQPASVHYAAKTVGADESAQLILNKGSENVDLDCVEHRTARTTLQATLTVMRDTPAFKPVVCQISVTITDGPPAGSARTHGPFMANNSIMVGPNLRMGYEPRTYTISAAPGERFRIDLVAHNVGNAITEVNVTMRQGSPVVGLDASTSIIVPTRVGNPLAQDRVAFQLHGTAPQAAGYHSFTLHFRATPQNMTDPVQERTLNFSLRVPSGMDLPAPGAESVVALAALAAFLGRRRAE